MKKANYRKINDRSHNSSTYHKKDGTPVRHRLQEELQAEIKELQAEIDELREIIVPSKPGTDQHTDDKDQAND